MAAQPIPIPIPGGRIIVEFPPRLRNYSAHPKPIPDDLINHPDYNDYMWVDNFGIRDDKGKAAPPHLPEHYTILVLKESDKDELFYWDGESILPLAIERWERRGGADYAVAKLDLGDPPVAWG